MEKAKRGDAPIEAPATEPGRTLYDVAEHMKWTNDAAVSNRYMLDAILAIEAAARDEGRREGCSKHHSAEDCRAYFDQTLEEARDEGRQEAVRQTVEHISALASTNIETGMHAIDAFHAAMREVIRQLEPPLARHGKNEQDAESTELIRSSDPTRRFTQDDVDEAVRDALDEEAYGEDL